MKRIHLMGFDFSTGTFTEVLDEIRAEKFRAKGFLPFMITPNADQVLRYNESPGLKSEFESSYFILPDGFPIMVYSKVLRKPLASKLSGSDLFPMIWKMIVNENRSVFVIAPTEQVGELLKKEYPSMRYYVPGILNTENLPVEADRIVSVIGTKAFDYIIIGLGFPKQEMLTLLIHDKLKSDKKPLFMLLGASFEFYLGLKKRAPKWVTKVGFEWLHRLMQEPGRLWRRYTIGNFNFMVFFVKSYFNEKKGK